MKKFLVLFLAVMCIATCLVSCKNKKDTKDDIVDFDDIEPEYTSSEQAAITKDWEEYIASQEALPDDSPEKSGFYYSSDKSNPDL